MEGKLQILHHGFKTSQIRANQSERISWSCLWVSLAEETVVGVTSLFLLQRGHMTTHMANVAWMLMANSSNSLRVVSFSRNSLKRERKRLELTSFLTSLWKRIDSQICGSKLTEVKLTLAASFRLVESDLKSVKLHLKSSSADCWLTNNNN